MFIDSFLPNPIGKDTDGEWIKLFNDGNETINLSGWRLKDASGKTFIFKEQKIKAGEYLVLDYKTTKIPLNNNGETLFLYAQNGDLVSQAGYGGVAEEGKIFHNNQSAKELSASIIEPILNNQAISAAQKFDSGGLFIGIFSALILSVALIFIIKKLNIFSE
jgi:hypothetical protein